MISQDQRGAFLAWLRWSGAWLIIYLCSYAAMMWAQHAAIADWLRVVLTVLPIIPGVALLWSAVSSYRRCDEFVQQSILKAAALVAFVTAVWTLIYTYLQPLGLPLLPLGTIHAIAWPIFIWRMMRVIRIGR